VFIFRLGTELTSFAGARGEKPLSANMDEPSAEVETPTELPDTSVNIGNADADVNVEAGETPADLRSSGGLEIEQAEKEDHGKGKAGGKKNVAKHDSKESEVSYSMSRYNRGLNDWTSYQPMSSKPANAPQMPLTGKKKMSAPLPSTSDTARAYTKLPAANRVGSNGTAPPATEHTASADGASAILSGGAPPKRSSASEARPFVSPSRSETHMVKSTDDATHQAVALRLRRELDNAQQRAEIEISGRDHEIARLKGQVGMLKEKVTAQSVELKECLHALGEVKRENTAEVGLYRREGALAERRASSMQARLGAAAANSERVFAAANGQLEAVKNERNTLAEALAATASAVMGGVNVTLEELAMDAEAAMSEGSDPLPKRADSWMQFSYSSFEQSRHQHDGGGAIHSLIAAVSRLQRRCRNALDAEKGQRGLVLQLEEALGCMTSEYNAVEATTMTLFDKAITMQQLCGIVGLAPSKVEKGIIGRLKQVAHILEHVHGEFEEHKAERARMQSQIIELDFYSKLHFKLLEQGKDKDGRLE